jgi:hypothetical protein
MIGSNPVFLVSRAQIIISYNRMLNLIIVKNNFVKKIFPETIQVVRAPNSIKKDLKIKI